MTRITLNLFISYGRIDILAILTLASINGVYLYSLSILRFVSAMFCSFQDKNILCIWHIEIPISWGFSSFAIVNSTDFNFNSELFFASIDVQCSFYVDCLGFPLNKAPLSSLIPHVADSSQILFLFPQFRKTVTPTLTLHSSLHYGREIIRGGRLGHWGASPSLLSGVTILCCLLPNDENILLRIFCPALQVFMARELSHTSYYIIAWNRCSSRSL